MRLVATQGQHWRRAGSACEAARIAGSGVVDAHAERHPGGVIRALWSRAPIAYLCTWTTGEGERVEAAALDKFEPTRICWVARPLRGARKEPDHREIARADVGQVDGHAHHARAAQGVGTSSGAFGAAAGRDSGAARNWRHVNGLTGVRARAARSPAPSVRTARAAGAAVCAPSVVRHRHDVSASQGHERQHHRESLHTQKATPLCCAAKLRGCSGAP